MSASRYIASLRNKQKRAFAERYWAWLSAGMLGDAPDYRPLSYMAAQAVWLTLQRCYP